MFCPKCNFDGCLCKFRKAFVAYLYEVSEAPRAGGSKWAIQSWSWFGKADFTVLHFIWNHEKHQSVHVLRQMKCANSLPFLGVYFATLQYIYIISENKFLISESRGIFWSQKIIFDIKNNSLLISVNKFWYQKLFSDIKLFSDMGKWHDFLISTNDFWYQKWFSDMIYIFSDMVCIFWYDMYIFWYGIYIWYIYQKWFSDIGY